MVFLKLGLIIVVQRMDTSVLERIGLSKAEIQVYLALLRLGQVPSSRLIRETNFRKSTIYDSIRRLQEKGLVSSVVQDKKAYFEATEPDRLIDFVEDKKRELDRYGETVKGLTKDLEKEYGKIKPHAEAHVLLGPEGYKTMRRDSLKNAKADLCLLGAIGREYEVLPAFFENYNKTRIMKGIKWRVLAKKVMRSKMEAFKKRLVKNFEIRFLPDNFDNPAVINVYGNRVVNVLWKGDYPLCFMLINKDIADSYREYFEYLWKLSKP